MTPPGIEDVRRAAAHASRKVEARAAQHHDGTARHVLAAMIANPFDDGLRSGVSHREALSGPPAEERLSRSRAVQDGVADHHVLFGQAKPTLEISR